MNIKKVSIQGFKSFMDRLDIPFPPGLCAIVGPNGCGKSNIVDAIRWAMGEQSAKQLRGRQMEDLIFGGAGDEKPLGMAEVSLVFENIDGFFPAELSSNTEVSVTRRLYRSGESEYRLNGVPCRLKDIQEIFMDTGLGNKAYSIIGQGRISSIIEQKPEETRAMLEEAAGITKYKKKVEESRRKIELAEGNLLRVEDIVGEVQRQMSSLKRQASKARRFKSISEEIQSLELALNANAYQELKEDSADRTKRTDDLAQEEIAQSTALTGIQARVETMNLELDEKDKEISNLRKNFLSLKEKVNRKESSLESLSGDKRMELELKSRLKKEKEDVGRRLDGFQEERLVLKQNLEKTRQTSATLEDEISLQEKRLKSKRELLKQVKEEYERARTRVSSGVSKEMSLNQESGYLNKRIGEITDGRSRLEQEKRDVASKMSSFMEASGRKNKTREALAQKLRDIEEDISREQGIFNERLETRNSLETDLKLAEADLSIYQSRLASLRSLMENFEGYKIGVRTIMKATDLPARSEGRIKGLVADFIQVEPEYEQAVEAALADKLQYVVVERQEDGKEAVDYLKRKAKGRSSFVSLKELNGQAKGFGTNGSPLLKDLVSVPDSYRPLIDLLLEDALLAENLDEAISAWRKNGKDHCIVTTEGDMVDKRGVISGGKLAHRSHGILARKREIKELIQQEAEWKKRLEELRINLRNISLEIQGKEAVLDDLNEEKSRCQERISDLDKTIFQLSHELDQLERLSERIAGELEQRSKERSRNEEVLSKIESELESWKEKREEQEKYLLQRETELKETEDEFEQFRSELERLKTDYRLSLEEAKGLVREMERIEDFTEEAQERLIRIEEDISEGEYRYQECLKREESLREKLKGIYVELEQAENLVNRSEQDRNIFYTGIRGEEKRAEALRDELGSLREKISSSRLEESEIRFKMNGLVELVKDKFNLDLPGIFQEYLQEDFSAAEVRERLERQKNLREQLGEVNLAAIQEHEALKERHTFIKGQKEDLLSSIESLRKAIRKINKTSLDRFMRTFGEVDQKIKEVFPILFDGGTAGLKLVDETKPLDSGVLVQVRPPGKKLSHMGLLSGGEKALVAMALLFAIYLIKPSPFCLLDEVDAPLDEANIQRFNHLVKEINKYSQIILITHNRKSMEIVDRLYGVTMEKKGISTLVSVDFQGIDRA